MPPCEDASSLPQSRPRGRLQLAGRLQMPESLPSIVRRIPIGEFMLLQVIADTVVEKS